MILDLSWNCNWLLSCIFSFPLFPCRELNQIIGGMRKAENDYHKCSSHSNKYIVTKKKIYLTDRRNSKKLSQSSLDIENKNIMNETWPRPIFDLLNLVPSNKEVGKMEWRVVGNITMEDGPIINTIQLPSTSSSSLSSKSGQSQGSKHRFRVVTGNAPPFVQESTRLQNGSCLAGVHCLRVRTFYI